MENQSEQSRPEYLLAHERRLAKLQDEFKALKQRHKFSSPTGTKFLFTSEELQQFLDLAIDEYLERVQP